jgi:hypothetical protein
MALDSNSKLARVREAMMADDWEHAIQLAARFPALGDQSSDIRRANDAMNNPRLYEQLGHDLLEVRRKGIAALKKRFSKSWENVKNSSVKKTRRKRKPKGN